MFNIVIIIIIIIIVAITILLVSDFICTVKILMEWLFASKLSWKSICGNFLVIMIIKIIIIISDYYHLIASYQFFTIVIIINYASIAIVIFLKFLLSTLHLSSLIIIICSSSDKKCSSFLNPLLNLSLKHCLCYHWFFFSVCSTTNCSSYGVIRICGTFTRNFIRHRLWFKCYSKHIFWRHIMTISVCLMWCLLTQECATIITSI